MISCINWLLRNPNKVLGAKLFYVVLADANVPFSMISKYGGLANPALRLSSFEFITRVCAHTFYNT